MSTSSASSAHEHRSGSRAANPARQDRYRGLLAGLIGALVMVAVFMLLPRIIDTASVIETLADATLLAMPISIFSFLLDAFGSQAKTLFLVGLIVLLVLIGGGLGQTYAAQTAGAHRPIWPRAQAYAVGIAVVLGGFLLVIAWVQTPAAIRGMKMVWALVAVAIGAEVWAVMTALGVHALRMRSRASGATAAAPAGGTIGRRQAVTLAGIGVATLAAVAVIGREVQQVASRRTTGGEAAGDIPPPITPVGNFYVVSKNFVDPRPDRGDDWEIAVDGLVDHPGTITHAELLDMDVVDFVSTLTCISNPVGGELISTARWTGVPLADVLHRFGVQPGAVDLVGEGEDGYSDSFPIEKALAPETHIVWAMNGEPLPRLHGEPVRLIVPGLYGIKNVKWLTKMTVVDHDYQGYWQDRDWTDEGIVKTRSTIDKPVPRSVVPAGPVTVGGIAFAGDRGISKVEVSFDDGESWTEARIAANPGASELSWVIWKQDWSPEPGSYTLVVRATDGEGNLQTPDTAPTLPDGASGWHHVTVGVA